MDLKKYKETGAMDLSPEDFNDPGTMRVVDNLLQQKQNEWDKEKELISAALDIDFEWADCVWYLRTRTRWTQELENQLISMARNGETPPDMIGWPRG
jgi:hypothetical protein